MKLDYDEIASPIGTVVIVTSSNGVCALDFDDCRARMRTLLATRYRPLELHPRSDPEGFSTLVRAYFAGQLDVLGAIPVDAGGTAFQDEVWSAMRAIPPGQTRSYGRIACTIGRPAAARAVGMASGRNPVALIIPCHRVLGARGSLTGYAGGLQRKRWLLAHEMGSRKGSSLEVGLQSNFKT